MAVHTYNSAVLGQLEDIMRDFPEAVPDKLFGFPGYKLGGKTFVCVHEHGLLTKLGAARVTELVGTNGIQAFGAEPGRPWKDWCKITSDFEQRRDLIVAALRYVAESS
jgi:hypothetical protein